VTILPGVDRDSIQRRDFPVGRRGYDQGAVDAHLRAVADELDALRERASGLSAPRALSAGTSEQVRQILEAAERSAAQLKDQAGRDAGDHVTRVEAATGTMLEQLGTLQDELDAMLAALKRSGELLEAGLARLREDVRAVGPDMPEPAAAPEPPEPEPVPEPPVVAPDSPAAPAAPPAPAADEAGARLTALNLALSGTPREETERYLAEHYALEDPDALLDDVYRRAAS
jgi:DivIVA domain-containing protein